MKPVPEELHYVRLAKWLGCSYWELRQRTHGEIHDMFTLMNADIKFENWQREQANRKR